MPNDEEEITRGDEVFADLTHVGGRPGVAGIVIDDDPNTPHDFKVRTDEGVYSLTAHRVSPYDPTSE